jgi:hypothetical protein
MDTLKQHLLIQGGLLFIVASSALLAELFVAGPILLAEGFKDNPLLCGSILLFLCLVCLLCFAGSRMESCRVVQFFGRLLLRTNTFGRLLASRAGMMAENKKKKKEKQ